MSGRALNMPLQKSSEKLLPWKLSLTEWLQPYKQLTPLQAYLYICFFKYDQNWHGVPLLRIALRMFRINSGRFILKLIPRVKKSGSLKFWVVTGQLITQQVEKEFKNFNFFVSLAYKI